MADPTSLKFNSKVVTSGAMTANIASSVLDISSASGFTVHFFYTGTPTGSLITQTSPDGINFVTVDTKAITTAGSYSFNMPITHAPFVQIGYTFGSSTGVLNAYISAKYSI